MGERVVRYGGKEAVICGCDIKKTEVDIHNA